MKPYISRSIIFLIVILLISACDSKNKQSEQSKPNVLVILIDTLRADHLGFNGYERDTSPVIDKFASENLNFKYAYSSSVWTPPSVASLFTGVYASIHGHMPLKSEDALRAQGKFSKVDDGFTTLAEVYQSNGYDTACISANPMVHKNYGLSQGFTNFYSPGRETAEKINKRTLKYLTDIRDKSKPFFLYLQYIDPHHPYSPPAPYDSMFSGPLKAREYDEKMLKYIGRYDGEIKYTDDKVGEIFKWLRENKLYDDMVIMLLSDHGEQFMERGYLGHADKLHTEEAQIPFILKAKNQKGEVKVPVSLVDAYPTLLEASGLSFTSKINGVSLLSNLEQRKNQGVLLEIIRHVNQKAFINSEGQKIILEFALETPLINPLIAPILKESIYDIYNDNWEVHRLGDPKLLDKLKLDLKNLYIEILKLGKDYKTAEMEMDDETFENLKTLGYI